MSTETTQLALSASYSDLVADMKSTPIKYWAKKYVMKVANMRKEQSFTLYPYTGGDEIFLQSDSRWIEANLRSGEAKILASNQNYPNRWSMMAKGHIAFKLPEETLKEIQSFLWHNEGKDGKIGNVLSWANKPLFSEKGVQNA